MYKEFSMVLSTMNYSTLVCHEQAHNLCKKSCTNYADNDIFLNYLFFVTYKNIYNYTDELNSNQSNINATYLAKTCPFEDNLSK